MEIEKALELKQELEANILKLVKRFSDDTKLEVYNVDLSTMNVNTMHPKGNDKYTAYHVEVNVKL